ncbi:hypothetical protein [Bradyrhizobium sp. 63_E2_N1_3]|uniref:hypothetical protein n=1 Tax=Bradyrhizobium sp. 63_E2_N1_3 TaxID=3240373 RepID=UPI003F8BB2EA
MIGHLFDWTVERTEKDYRVVVVEPPFIEPTTHGGIFDSAITALLTSDNAPVSDLRPNVPVIERFDLVTFPEAFLPVADFIRTIGLLSRFERLGCIHVGLRPDLNEEHLFDNASILNLLAELRSISSVELEDLEGVLSWIKRQAVGKRFNLACLFTIDARAKLRICLHPKMVRSKVEAGALPERDMAQGDLVSLVRLIPSDPNLLSITMQPLICSDALQLDSDRPGHLPIDAVNSNGSCFGQAIPDYVDVVSVATCTPQSENTSQGMIASRMWHQQFRESFIRAAKDPSCQRHAHAAFVLANFWSLGASDQIDSSEIGGLSGVFLPVKNRAGINPNFMELSTYGKNEGDIDNSWSMPADKVGPKRSVRGYIAQLSPRDMEPPRVRMLRMTVHRLPRHAPPWGATVGLRDVNLHYVDVQLPADSLSS